MLPFGVELAGLHSVELFPGRAERALVVWLEAEDGSLISVSFDMGELLGRGYVLDEEGVTRPLHVPAH